MRDSNQNAAAPLSTAAQYILLALAEKDLHGYGLIQEIPKLSEDGYSLGPGTLYDNLKKLINAGLVTDAPRKADERRFYRITHEGRKVLTSEIARLQNLVTVHSRLRRQETHETSCTDRISCPASITSRAVPNRIWRRNALDF